jgi:hypothetical protein
MPVSHPFCDSVGLGQETRITDLLSSTSIRIATFLARVLLYWFSLVDVGPPNRRFRAGRSKHHQCIRRLCNSLLSSSSVSVTVPVSVSVSVLVSFSVSVDVDVGVVSVLISSLSSLLSSSMRRRRCLHCRYCRRRHGYCALLSSCESLLLLSSSLS